MKIFQICGYFKLPDDFEGTSNDAMRLLADYYVNAPPVANAHRSSQATRAMWAETWGDARTCFTTTELRFSGCTDSVHWDGTEWKRIPDPNIDAAVASAKEAGTYERPEAPCLPG